MKTSAAHVLDQALEPKITNNDFIVIPGGKSKDALRTIGEVAEELDIQPHILRFWQEKFRDLKPTIGLGGRRYYRPEDVSLLKRIRDLLYHQGYTIKGVQQLFKTSKKGEIEREESLELMNNTQDFSLNKNELTHLLAEISDIKKFLLS
jgi:DNA-binding transcriptional MerR regulator